MNTDSKKPLNQYEIIDFHTHVFPDNIAQKVTDNVGNYYNLSMHGNGSKADLLSGKGNLNVTKFVISYAALNPSKTVPINNFIHDACISNSEFIGLGSVHRDTPDVLEEIERMLSLGIRGIKIHPEFQGFDIDDEKMFPIYEKAEGRLPILFHVEALKSDRSNPKRLRRIMDKFEGLTVIAAHMGGYKTSELSKEYILGTRAYMDTSTAQSFTEPDELVKIIRQHGTGKILFGSDFPILYTHEAAKELYELNLSDKELADIFSNNAKRLFGL